MAGTWFGFANPVAHVPPLALLLPGACAFVAVGAPSAGAALRRGWLVGAAGYGAGLYWIALPVRLYGDLPWALAAPCPVLVGLALGGYTGLFALGVHTVGRRLHWALAALWAGGLWALLEAARGVLFTGFPWLVLASAFSAWPAAVQGAAWLGATGLSGIFAGAAALVATGRGPWPRAAGVAALGLLLGLGAWALGQPLETTGSARVLIAQGNVDQSLKWDELYRLETVRRYAAITENGLRDAPADLVVWPETALPFYMQEPSSYSVAVRQAVREAKTPLLTGTPAYTFDAATQTFLMHNRAVLLDADGASLGSYDKEHLVPFGEYVPFGDYLPFIKKLAHGAGDFVPGVSTAPLDAGALRLGVLICYETIFPELAQARVAAGANVLVNISNDAWFGRTAAPHQHLAMSVLRAVEQRRTLVRGTNNGISAFIDPRGRVLRAGGQFVAAAYQSPELPLVAETTFFHRHRMGLGAALALVLGLCAALALLEKRRAPARLAQDAASS
ncbi:apolipoprotein N-acyltransferase [Desulfocurvus vexinensis]|uniref:apolipoprotein N-acyltransferase n=1 Tax=Desulfocurvus vexinensis TaxID=399548 RepID=UPI00048DC0C4|nr:apolipoprotein N-acyltransferase [Desulfocurvus vexinensis]